MCTCVCWLCYITKEKHKKEKRKCGAKRNIGMKRRNMKCGAVSVPAGVQVFIVDLRRKLSRNSGQKPTLCKKTKHAWMTEGKNVLGICSSVSMLCHWVTRVLKKKKTLNQHQHRDQRQTLAFSILASASASAMRIQHPCIIPKYQFDKSRLHVFSISP